MKVILFRSINPKEKRQLLRGIKKSVQLISIPALSFKTLKWTLPKSKGQFDYILITSAQTFRHVKKFPSTKNFVLIGEETKRAFDDARKSELISQSNARVVQLKNSRSKGILDYFRSGSRGCKLGSRAQNKRVMGSIFFPRSALGDEKIVKQLKAIGYDLTVRKVYRTKLNQIKEKLSSHIRGQEPVVFLVTSPSIFQAARRGWTSSQLKSKHIQWVAIGPTTASEMKKFKIYPVVSKKASAKHMIQTLTSKMI